MNGCYLFLYFSFDLFGSGIRFKNLNLFWKISVEDRSNSFQRF